LPRQCALLPLVGRREARLGPCLCHACRVGSGLGGAHRQVLDRFASLRQHQRAGQRSPHKPLLVLLALGRLAATGSSELPWSAAESELADLIAEFGPPSRTSRAQSAAYPFTRLRADGVWVLNHDVQMDLVGPLASGHVPLCTPSAWWARTYRHATWRVSGNFHRLGERTKSAIRRCASLPDGHRQ